MISQLEEEILTLLGDRTLYGLQMTTATNEASGGERSLKVGSLYPTLKRMEDDGLIKGQWGDEQSGGGRRRYYAATSKGIEELKRITAYRKALAKWKES